MQQESKHPARRHLVYILAVLLPGLSGCGGGGGSSAAAPPQINAPNPIGGGGSLDGGTAGILFQEVQGSGRRWLGLVDSDSGYIPLRGSSPYTNDALEKYPAPQPVGSITTQYSKLSYIRTRLTHTQDPGRYILWGTQTQQIKVDQIDYHMNGAWTCVLCQRDGTIR